MNSRILVTGAQGFIGRYLVSRWLHAERDVRVLGVGRSIPSPDSFTHQVRWANVKVPAPIPSSLAGTELSARYSYESAGLQLRHAYVSPLPLPLMSYVCFCMLVCL